ncbi:hypothetical protein I553_7437 [Mycobacterium xenopi 4042]|uniref:Uncharacterized protein n=1 Tax=Mycobacterium xenopi 4042 TaxID=1299334 RepID=X8E896_MYCXE|nr:hypothetical protein I553_7437 [Mycobacterium xenopi 4042]
MDLIADLLAAHVDIDAITGLLDDGPPRVRTSPAGWANSSAAVANTPLPYTCGSMRRVRILILP